MEILSKEAKEFKKNHEIFMAHKRSFVGLVDILYEEKLPPPARILFFIISGLSFQEGYCYATNNALGERLGLKPTMVKQYLNKLVALKFIEIKKVVTDFGIRRQLHIRFDILRKQYLKTEDTKWKNPVRGRNPDDDRDIYPHPEDY